MFLQCFSFERVGEPSDLDTSYYRWVKEKKTNGISKAPNIAVLHALPFKYPTKPQTSEMRDRPTVHVDLIRNVFFPLPNFLVFSCALYNGS
jgi:hypothetical protein